MNEKPKLTYLISSLETGGAEVGMARLLDGLPPNAFEVTVVALYGGDQTVVSDIPSHIDVVDLNMENKLLLYKLSPLIPILRETDILVGSIYHAEILARLFKSIIEVDTLLTWAHNTEFQSPLRRWVDKLTIGRCDAVLADSKAVATMLIDQQGVNPDKIWKVPIAGISVDKYEQSSISLRALDDSIVGGEPLNDVNEDAIIIGIVGTLIEPKNHDAVLDIATRLTDQNIHVAIAGDGPRRQELIDIISDRGLTNVSLLGYVDSVPDFLSTVDIYIQPSHYEGLCITVVEAMAAGKPIVASDVGEIPTNVKHGTHGFVTSADNIDGFEQQLRQLINNPNLRHQMGEAARDRVRNRYSQKCLAEKFQTVVEKAYLKSKGV